MRWWMIVTACGVLGGRAAAQGQTAPAGWKWLTDGAARMVATEAEAKGGPGRMWFVEMAPGYHVTTGPGAVLYHPNLTAEGRFELESEFFLFPDASGAEYGVMIGGKQLDGSDARWLALVVRGDGSAGVMERKGGADRMVREWRAASAVVAAKPGGSARNVVKVVVGADVRFLVNGAEVAKLPRADIDADGAVGLRVGNGVNLHVTSFDLLRRLAPVPPPKAAP